MTLKITAIAALSGALFLGACTDPGGLNDPNNPNRQRDTGVLVGAGVGAATGTAINTRDHAETDQHTHHDTRHPVDGSPHAHPHGNTFCPPGQAKKGRC